MRASKIESQTLDLYRQGLNDNQIADALDVTSSSVWHIRKKHGLPPNIPPPAPKKPIAPKKPTAPKKPGAGDLEVLSWLARRLGLTYGQLVSSGDLDMDAARREYREYRKQRAAQRAVMRPKTPKHSLDREKAARLYDQGLSDPKIAKECGVSPLTIFKWRKATGRQAPRTVRLLTQETRTEKRTTNS